MATAATEIYTLSLHDALPISTQTAHERQDHVGGEGSDVGGVRLARRPHAGRAHGRAVVETRSEEHTSELQSRLHLVCRLLLEKKKKLDTGERAATDGFFCFLG